MSANNTNQQDAGNCISVGGGLSDPYSPTTSQESALYRVTKEIANQEIEPASKEDRLNLGTVDIGITEHGAGSAIWPRERDGISDFRLSMLKMG